MAFFVSYFPPQRKRLFDNIILTRIKLAFEQAVDGMAKQRKRKY